MKYLQIYLALRFDTDIVTFFLRYLRIISHCIFQDNTEISFRVEIFLKFLLAIFVASFLYYKIRKTPGPALFLIEQISTAYSEQVSEYKCGVDEFPKTLVTSQNFLTFTSTTCSCSLLLIYRN